MAKVVDQQNANDKTINQSENFEKSFQSCMRVNL